MHRPLDPHAVHCQPNARRQPPPTAAAPQEGAAPRAIVPVVRRPAAPGGFPGLYAGGFPEAAFVTDRLLLVNSQWYSQGVALAVDLATGDVAPVTPVGGEHGSWVVQVGVPPASLHKLASAAAARFAGARGMCAHGCMYLGPY